MSTTFTATTGNIQFGIDLQGDMTNAEMLRQLVMSRKVTDCAIADVRKEMTAQRKAKALARKQECDRACERAGRNTVKAVRQAAANAKVYGPFLVYSGPWHFVSGIVKEVRGK